MVHEQEKQDCPEGVLGRYFMVTIRCFYFLFSMPCQAYGNLHVGKKRV